MICALNGKKRGKNGVQKVNKSNNDNSNNSGNDNDIDIENDNDNDNDNDNNYNNNNNNDNNDDVGIYRVFGMKPKGKFGYAVNNNCNLS